MEESGAINHTLRYSNSLRIVRESGLWFGPRELFWRLKKKKNSPLTSMLTHVSIEASRDRAALRKLHIKPPLSSFEVSHLELYLTPF